MPPKLRGRPKKKVLLEEAQDDSLNISAMSAGMNTKGASNDLLAEPPKKRGKYANYRSRENFPVLKAAIKHYCSLKMTGMTQDNSTDGDDNDETALCTELLVRSVSPLTIRTYIAHLQKINKIPSDDFTYEDLFPNQLKHGLLTDMQVRDLSDIIVYRDRNNNGVERREAIQYIMEISGCGSRKTAENHLDYLIRSKRFPNLKRDGRVMKAQATTTKRSQITIAQQFRWHCLIDEVWADQAQRNQPCEDFEKLKEHFMGNLDETGVAASEGCLHIIGEKEQKKHEKNTDDSRESITAVRIGNAAGNEGPYIFLAKGKKMECKSLQPNVLREKGAPGGSRVIMTPSAYMNDVAWLEMAPYLADGI